MAGNRIADLFAQLSFRVDRAGLDKFTEDLKRTKREIGSSSGIAGEVNKAEKSVKKSTKRTKKNVSAALTTIKQKFKSEVPPTIHETRKLFKLMERDYEDGKIKLKEYEKYKARVLEKMRKHQERIDRDHSKALKEQMAQKDREADAFEKAERDKRSAMERTRNKLIQVTRRYSAHDAKLMQIRDSVRAVNKARRDGLITLERAQQEVGQLTNEYRRLQAAQSATRAAGPRVGAAGGIYAGGEDPRQVGNHRIISAIHSDIGLGAMMGGFAAFQSSRAYQDWIAMQRTMKASTGSAEAGAAEMEWLINLSDKLGISLSIAGDNYKNFLAATKGTELAGEETRGMFEAVSAYGKVLNLSAADTQGSFRALVQMVS